MKKLVDISNIKGDVFGGVTAGIVALPLALAFGVQSGMGAIAGLYGAMILGMIAAIFGGTNTQVSGPTGPMTVVAAAVIATAIETAGSLEAGLGIIIASFVLCGLIQVGVGLMKVGDYVRFIPYPVLSGFMSGIGVIIFVYQIFPFFGAVSPRGTENIFIDIFTGKLIPNLEAFIVGSITVIIIYTFPKLTKNVPAPLVALLAVTGGSVALGCDVPRIGDIPTGFPDLQFGSLLSVSSAHYWLVVEYGATLAALGAIDSLLTSVIADNITKTKHNSDRELIGQGIGNAVAGIFGGLPGAGATMRTVVNIKAGGKTKISGFIHGVLLVAILLGLGRYAALIPLSVLAGILITVGIGIVDYKGFRHLRIVPRAEAIILLVVLGITVFGSLLYAVAVGMIFATFVFMSRMSKIVGDDTVVTSIRDFERELPWKDEGGVPKHIADKIYVKHLDGPLFFGFTSQFKALLKAMPEVQIVIIRMDKVPYIDQSGLYALEESILDLERKGVGVVMTGLDGQPLDMLRRLRIVPSLISETYLFTTFSGCSKWLKENFDAYEDGFQRILDELVASKKS